MLLREKFTCPYCWTESKVEDVLWISEAPELIGDYRLGETDHRRFLPARFDVKGNAIDLRGFSCKKLACPYCHLEIPRSLLEMPPFFISLAGAPASGKSYFLTSMIWNLRKVLSKEFHIAFQDADPEMNHRLQEYEALQFLNDNPEAIVKIEKTEEQGEQYKTVLINDDQYITYLQPFLFTLCPMSTHARGADRVACSKTLTIYDNAGESYLPVRDGDTASLPVTRHLEQSNCIMFTFDPLQDNRFRNICTNPHHDPQLDKDQEGFHKSPLRQEQILNEMIRRTRTHLGMSLTEKYKKPLIIVVTKLDAWQDLLPGLSFRNCWARVINTNTTIFMENKVQEVSNQVRALLNKYIPEMTSQLDLFADNVTYIPVSATGCSPVRDPQTGNWGFPVKNINPVWVEVPLLYALSQSSIGLFELSNTHKNK